MKILLIDGGSAGKTVEKNGYSFLELCYDKNKDEYYEQVYFLGEVTIIHEGKPKSFFFGSTKIGVDYNHILTMLIEGFKK